MEFNFWKNVWDEHQIGFHQSEINKNLKNFVKHILPKDDRILVPLCGKSLDMIYLTQQGLSVDGVEIVESAIQEFFQENSITPHVTQLNEVFMHYQSDNISLYCGDFHQYQTLEKKYQAVYDRASMIALPLQMRKSHAKTLSDIVYQKGKILLITLEYQQEKVQGPPFSVEKNEIHHLFEESFLIEELSYETTKNIGPKFINAGIQKVGQRVYLLEKK